jgi:hypothetical protein
LGSRNAKGRLIVVKVAELTLATARETAIAITASTTATVSTTAIIATTTGWAVIAKITAGRRRTTARGRRAVRARGAFFFGAGFDDLQWAATDGGVVEAFHGSSGFAVIGHVHESKTAGAAGFTIFDDTGVSHGAVGGELVQQLFVCERVRQVANIEVHLNL